MVELLKILILDPCNLSYLTIHFYSSIQPSLRFKNHGPINAETEFKRNVETSFIPDIKLALDWRQSTK